MTLAEVSAEADSLSDLLSEPLCPPPAREVRREGGRFVSLDGHSTSAEWDWYWQLPDRERQRLKPWFTPTGLAPDQWLSAMRYRVGDDLDSAMSQWVLATKLADAAGRLKRGREVDFVELSEYECPVPTATGRVSGPQIELQGLVGPQEVAEALGVQVNTVHVWRKRGKLPPARVISGVPIWTLGSILEWARETDRL